MVEEMESLYKNETWDLVKLPSGRNPIGRKWVFKKKMNVAGQVEKLKARLVLVLNYSYYLSWDDPGSDLPWFPTKTPLKLSVPLVN
jgi:hypothetical protein